MEPASLGIDANRNQMAPIGVTFEMLFEVDANLDGSRSGVLRRRARRG